MKKVAISLLSLACLAGGLEALAYTVKHPHPKLKDEQRIDWKKGGTWGRQTNHYLVYPEGWSSHAWQKSKNYPYKDLSSDLQKYGWAKAERDTAWNDPNGFDNLTNAVKW